MTGCSFWLYPLCRLLVVSSHSGVPAESTEACGNSLHANACTIVPLRGFCVKRAWPSVIDCGPCRT